MAKTPDAFEQAARAAQANREADALIQDMMDGTQNEIAAGAWGDEPAVHDETGDRSLEALGEGLEGQVEPDDEETGEDADTDETGEEGEGEEEAGEAEPKPGEETAEATPPQGRVPSGRLREATAERDALKAERDALKAQLDGQAQSFERKMAELAAEFRGQITALRGTQPPATEKKPEPPKAPDMFENPEGFTQHLLRSFDERLQPLQQDLRNREVRLSLRLAKVQHGKTLDDAVAEIAKLDQSNPHNQQFIANLYNADDPGEALVAWHKDNIVRREVGNDPAAYRDKIAKETRDALMKDPEFRKQLLEGLRAEATGADGRPQNTTVRLPPSLNRANGGGREAVDTALLSAGDQQSIADAAWMDN